MSKSEQLGDYLRRARHRTGRSLRDIADAIGSDSGTMSRIEQGQTRHPAPALLAAWAKDLDIPAHDLFALAGYDAPKDLPTFKPYLRSRYGLTAPMAEEMATYFDFLRTKYGLSADGPAPGEDEVDDDADLPSAA